jgi:hypothetical protein
VAYEAILPDLSTFGYVKSDYGEKLGDPLAGLLLDFSLKHPNCSLGDLFAITNSASRSENDSEPDLRKRAPITRLRILRELLSSEEPLRSVDLADSIGTDRTIMGKHLFTLSEKGIAHYERTRQGRPRFQYRFSKSVHDTNPNPHRKYNRTATDFIYNLIKGKPDKAWTQEEVLKAYADYLRNEGKNVPRHLDTTTVGALAHLAKTGFALVGKFYRGKQSEAYLNEEQRKMLSELTETIDAFVRRDPEMLVFGRKRLREILANPMAVSELIQKAREHSPKRIDVRESSGYLKNLIADIPHSTTIELFERLTSEGRRLSMAQIRAALIVLEADGSVQVSQEKGIKHYDIITRSMRRRQTA